MDTLLQTTTSPLNTVHREHEIPFGAQVLPNGATRFRLWAPAAAQVDLLLEEQPPIPMTPEGEGFFSITIPDISPGVLYQYRLDEGEPVPDPASRFQPRDIHGPSALVYGGSFAWNDAGWLGRPWEEAVIYELHVGTFSPEGTYAGVQKRLDELVELGVTAIELLPLSDFPGERNWGYDGVLPYAPDSRYGTPDDLKALVQACHEKGLMIFLDVVYNHFGPEGNYLWNIAPDFFTREFETPWGTALNFAQQPVRQFFTHNALYWLEEYHFDGLRLDAVQMIKDLSERHFLAELAEAVQNGPGQHRHVHLILENDDNGARHLVRDDAGKPLHHTAQWNDDFHHVVHLLATGETDGYYADYAESPMVRLGRALTQGFIYQGEPSPYRDGERRGEPSADLPTTAFINFLQNHDQIGNRAFGDRIGQLADASRLRAVIALYLLGPHIPMLFMGEEWATERPFPFLCDFGPDLAPKVTEGRRKEFGRFPAFRDPEQQARIPDPCAPETFHSAVLDWENRTKEPHASYLSLYKQLLSLRQRDIVPFLGANHGKFEAKFEMLSPNALAASWTGTQDPRTLRLVLNLGEENVTAPALNAMIFSSAESALPVESGRLIIPAKTTVWGW